MVFKIDIGYKGKTFHLEVEAEALNGKKIGEKIDGVDIKSELTGAEFEITGASDTAGFPASADVEGTGLSKKLLTEGFAMKHKHKQKKTSNPKLVKGLRLRRTLRGNTISSDISQVNLKLTKEGAKPLLELLGLKDKAEKKEEKSAEQIQTEMKEMMEKAKTEEPAEAKKEEKPVEKPKAEEKPAEKLKDEKPAEKTA